MLHMLWPLALAVVANIFYNIASREVPPHASPWGVLVITYLTGAMFSLLGFFIFENQKNFAAALRQTNWTGICLGLSMVGIEIGYIFMYRHGWKISVASLLSNILLAIALLFIGIFIYRERLGPIQLFGTGFCIIGCLLLLLARE